MTTLLRSVDPNETDMTHQRLTDLARTSYWVLGKMFVDHGSQIVALGVLVPKSEFDTVRIEKIAVAEGSRHQGIGIQLMHRLVDLARVRAFRNVEAPLAEEGSPVDRLLRRFHFQRNANRYLLTLD